MTNDSSVIILSLHNRIAITEARKPYGVRFFVVLNEYCTVKIKYDMICEELNKYTM